MISICIYVLLFELTLYTTPVYIGGDVFIALTNNKNSPAKTSDDLVNNDVDTMANAGDQPTLLFYK